MAFAAKPLIARPATQGLRFLDQEEVSFDQAFSIGALYSYNGRHGYFDIRGLRQDTLVPPLHLAGIVGGKRFRVTPWLRFQASAIAAGGQTAIDTMTNVPLTDGSYHDLARMQKYFFGELIPELQYVLPHKKELIPFLRMGIGVRYCRMDEEGKIIDDPATNYAAVKLPDATRKNMVSVDLQGGLGIDIPLNSHAGINFGYLYHYGQPVRYEYDSEMPRGGVIYWESFRTHEFAANLIWEWR
jgi:hypothetical protein